MPAMKRKTTVSLKRPVKRPALTPAQTAAVQRQVDTTLAKSLDYKICTTEVSSVGVDFSGTTFDLLSTLIRGDNARNNFEGAHVQAKNIHIRGRLACADGQNTMRMVVFQWLDDTPPTTTSVLDNAGIIGTVDAPYATRNWSNKHLYRILRDDRITLALPQISSANGSLYDIDYFIKGPKLQRTYYAATIPTVQKGGLYMLVVSDSGAIAHPSIIFTSEIVFTD